MTPVVTPWGKGKNQVLALKSEIIALLLNGESLLSSYHILSEAGKLNVGERTFRRHAAAFRADALKSPQSFKAPSSVQAPTGESSSAPSRPTPAPVQSPPHSETPPTRKRGPFDHNSFVTPEELDSLVYGHPQQSNAKEPEE
ncbi:MAG: hypothetical protein HQL35_13995 [Alphaproteobacteria bacterium]|nr:hypothetical protein [Alphaproteobacteria bacterium]